MDDLRLNERVYNEKLANMLLFNEKGKISKNIGLTFEAFLPGATIGSVVEILPNSVAGPIDPRRKSKEIKKQDVQGCFAEVIGFKDKKAILMALDSVHGVSNASRVVLIKSEATTPVGSYLLGRVIDGKGEPIDNLGPLYKTTKHLEYRNLYGTSINPLERKMIEEPLDLGVRAINGLLTCGRGQRMGIMAGSGVGKSVLLGMMARHTKADVNVIALIGERGREVTEFIDRDLGAEGLKKSVAVVSTSDKSPLLRMRAAFMATTIAEYFADQGLDVLLLMDSVTRFCMAQREIGLSMGEPPASKGYTPSVFSTLPKLLERAGSRKRGTITGLYTVLVDGDDMDEPIADATRSILDGHIVLSRDLAARNHYPAIDVSRSISRVMRAVISNEHRDLAGKVKELMAIHQANEDLINIGAYVKGSNPRLDQAISVIERIKFYLKQDIEDKTTYEESVGMLRAILTAAGLN